MNQKQKGMLFLIVAVLALASINYFAYTQLFQDDNSPPKAKVCPDEWIINKMSETDKVEDEYMVISGIRIEKDEFDINWVKENCEVNKPTPVY